MNGDGIQAALIRFAISFRGVIIALAIVLLGYGAYMLQRAKYDVFPEFAPPQVSIQTEAPGLAAEQVEILVTQPLENSLNGALGISTVRSASIQGLSVIVAMFDPSLAADLAPTLPTLAAIGLTWIKPISSGCVMGLATGSPGRS